MSAFLRTEVTYEGSVQGVGFRYTTQRTAGDYDVSGYVRNQRDGTVEVLAEGPSTEVEAFLSAVAQRMRGHIRKARRRNLPGERTRASFDVRYV